MIRTIQKDGQILDMEEGNEEEIIERYKIQMKYYKEALEKITESRVKEIYLYLFALDKEVVLEI